MHQIYNHLIKTKISYKNKNVTVNHVTDKSTFQIEETTPKILGVCNLETSYN